MNQLTVLWVDGVTTSSIARLASRLNSAIWGSCPFSPLAKMGSRMRGSSSAVMVSKGSSSLVQAVKLRLKARKAGSIYFSFFILLVFFNGYFATSHHRVVFQLLKPPIREIGRAHV